MEDKAVKKTSQILVVSIVLLMLSGVLQAQAIRYMTVGTLRISQDRQGGTWVSAITSQGQYGPGIVYNWEPYPDFATDVGYHGVDINAGGEHSGHGKALYGQSSFWTGSTQWTAPAAGEWGPLGAEAVYEAGKTYDIFVNDNGPVTLSALINTPYYADGILVRRVDMPTITVNNIPRRPVVFDPDGNAFSVDASLKVDGYSYAKWSDPMGVTYFEKRYGFTHPDYEAIIIADLDVINTGDANASIAGLEKDGQSLTEFWVGVKHLLADAYDWTDFGSLERYNGEVDWLLEYDTTTRYFWAWDGDATDITGDDQFDPRGGPIGTGLSENPTGEFTAPEVSGYAFLYVSAGPETGTPADDPDQPATFRYKTYKDMFSPVQGIGTMTEAWNWMTGEDGADMYQTGHSADPYQEVPDALAHYDPVFGVGPYDLVANDSIKIVLAFAVGSIPEARAIELGVKVKAGTITLADAKKEIYEGGRDSLFTLFARAQDLYDNYITKDIAVPFVPDPPDNIVMDPGLKLAELSWDAVSGVDGYKVYRATGGIDNGRVYRMIKDTTGTSYTDIGLTRGVSYYYYITSYKGDLESSHFFTRTHGEVVPYRVPPEEEDWADDVRVVPNPINVKGNTYKIVEGKEDQTHNTTGFNYDGGLREQNTLLFVNIPDQCNIYIYSSTGDLIKKLEHTTGTGDERWSPIITDDNLTPASGVYFYIIEVTEATTGPLAGQIAKGKFIVIR